MTEALKILRAELLVRKKELEKELNDLSQEKFSDGQVQDAGDQAASSTMENVRNLLGQSRKHEYHRLIKALEMMDKGTYGVCIDCGCEILEKRLKSFPNATRCVGCQERFEDPNQVTSAY